MADGDLIEERWQHELGGYLLGVDDGWDVVRARGWFGMPLKVADQDYTYVPGSVANPAPEAARVITLHLKVSLGEGMEDEVGALYAELLELWSDTDTDRELHAWVPGMGHVYVVGRSRPLEMLGDEEAGIPFGVLELDATFVAHTPTIVVVDATPGAP